MYCRNCGGWGCENCACDVDEEPEWFEGWAVEAGWIDGFIDPVEYQQWVEEVSA